MIVPTLEGIQSVDSGRVELEDANVNRDALDSHKHPSDAGGSGIMPLNGEDNAAILALSHDISKSLQDDFKFEDLEISRGWGD